MSRVTELARAEADALEALETEDPEPEPEPEPEPTPEPEPQTVTEKDLKAMGRVIETYHNGIKRVMGTEADNLHECPTCKDTLPGFVFEEPSPLDQFEVDPEKIECPMCKGMGQLRSGAKTVNALVMCMTCTGNGYVTKTPPVAAYVPPNGVAPGTVPPGYLAPSSEAMPTMDQWGRPLGHIHFGVPPSSIGG